MPELRIAQSLGSGENIDGFPGVPVPTTYQTPDFYSAIQDYLDTYGYSSNAGAGAGSGGIADLSNEAPHSELMEDVSESGTSDKAARSDHVHGMPGFGGVVPQIAFGQRFSSGFSPSVARADHTHGTPPLDTTNIVSINTAQTITGAKTFSALLTASGGLLASSATIGNTSITGTLGVTGATTLGTLALSSLTTKDVLTGGAGAGLGNLAAQTVDAYNIKDGAIIATKLSLPAVASVVASGAGNNTANSFFRFAYANYTYIDPVTGAQLSGINTGNGASIVTDPQAYQNYAVYIPSTTAAGLPGQGITPGTLSLPDGIYNVTVYVRVGANTSSSAAATFTATPGAGPGTTTVTGTPSVNANQLSTTGYMGYSFAVTLAGGVTDLRIRTVAQGFDVYVSHITGIPVAATFAPYLSSVFSPNVFATAATISSVSATSLVAGTIASDDIYLGTGGHIYAGTKGGARVELNAGGLYAYSNASTITLQALNTGSITITGTINATGGSFSGNITATGTISGGTISGAQFTNGSNFSVSPTGTLTAINGTIGGWTLGTTTLNGTGNLVSLDSSGFIKVTNSGGVYAALDGRNLQNLVDVVQGSTHVFKVDSSGNVSITGNVNATGGNFSGNITSTATISGGTISGAQFTNGTTFSVTSAGALTAASGTIGGWSINSTSLSAGSSTFYNNGNVTIQNLTAAGGSFSGTITSTATISGGVIEATAVRTATVGNNRIQLSGGTVSLSFIRYDGSTFGHIDGDVTNTRLTYWATSDHRFQNGTVTCDNTLYANNGMYAGSWGVYDNNNRVYSAVNPPSYPVTSVNGQTGAVSLTTGVSSVNGLTGAVSISSVASATDSTNTSYMYNQFGGKIQVTADGTYSRIVLDGTAEFRAQYGCQTNWTGSKTFVIQHPTTPDRYLVHAASEGPTADVHYRGEGRLDGSLEGKAVITLPSYFEALTQVDGRTISVTPILGCEPDCPVMAEHAGRDFICPNLAVSQIVNGQFTVKFVGGWDHRCARFFWEVKAVRKDTPQFEVEPDKARYALHGDGPYTYLTATGR